MPPTIRVARPADFEPLLRLIKAYYAFDSIAFDRRLTGRALRKLLRDSSLGRAFVIDAGRTLAGYAIVTFNYDLEFGGLEGIITDMYIAPTSRRSGLGARLIDTICDFCRGAGIDAVELQVTRTNRAARKFYRALGFEELDRIVMSRDV